MNARHTCAHGGQHAQRSAGNAVHVGQGEGHVDADGDDEAGENGRLVAKGQAKDDICGGTSAARVGHVLHQQEGSQCKLSKTHAGP